MIYLSRAIKTQPVRNHESRCVFWSIQRVVFQLVLPPYFARGRARARFVVAECECGTALVDFSDFFFLKNELSRTLPIKDGMYTENTSVGLYIARYPTQKHCINTFYLLQEYTLKVPERFARLHIPETKHFCFDKFLV